MSFQEGNPCLGEGVPTPPADYQLAMFLFIGTERYWILYQDFAVPREPGSWQETEKRKMACIDASKAICGYGGLMDGREAYLGFGCRCQLYPEEKWL